MMCGVWLGERMTVVAALALAASACSSSTGAARPPSATVGTETPRTTTTNPYAVLAVIDTAYVNRVLAGLDAAVGGVTRLVVRTYLESGARRIGLSE